MIELLILYVLSKRESTMYAVLKQILDNFGVYTQPSFGAVKPALTRLEKQGFIRSRKAMSEGGKLSGFYSITEDGRKELKTLILEDFSQNPLQFDSNSRIKLSCASYLPKDERNKLFSAVKSKALEYKFLAEGILADSQNSLDFYQKITLDNKIVEYKNFVSFVESLEKENS